MFKSKVAIGVAGIAVLAGAGGTYAATHRSTNTTSVRRFSPTPQSA